METDCTSISIEDQHFIALGLGSNKGDKLNNLESAISLIQHKEIIKEINRSKIYQTKALLLNNSPIEWDIDFYNMAICGVTQLTPLELLRELQLIEIELSREQNHAKWSPRTIDIDILFYDSRIIIEDSLQIPHPELIKRDFVLSPLNDIIPNFVHPVFKKIISELVKNDANLVSI